MTLLTPTHIVLSLLIGVAVLTPAKGEDQLQDRVDRIAKEVGGIVGIELKEQVVAERISRDEYRKTLGGQVEILLPKKRLGGLLRSWQLLGLLPDDNFDFEALLDLTVSATGATYKRREFSVVFLRSTGCKNPALVASALWGNKTNRQSTDRP